MHAKVEHTHFYKNKNGVLLNTVLFDFVWLFHYITVFSVCKHILEKRQ